MQKMALNYGGDRQDCVSGRIFAEKGIWCMASNAVPLRSLSGDLQVSVWGSGSPRREFLYSDDMADACVYLMKQTGSEFNALIADHAVPPLINIGCGQALTIRELAETVAETVGFDGPLEFDMSKPDGTPQKRLDVSRLMKVGWQRRTELKCGVRMVYREFMSKAETAAREGPAETRWPRRY